MNYEEIREEAISKFVTYTLLCTRAYDLVQKQTHGSYRYHKAWKMAEYFRGQQRAYGYCIHTIDLRIKAQRERIL